MAKRTPQLKVGEELILPALLHTVIAKMSIWNELGAGVCGGDGRGEVADSGGRAMCYWVQCLSL